MARSPESLLDAGFPWSLLDTQCGCRFPRSLFRMGTAEAPGDPFGGGDGAVDGAVTGAELCRDSGVLRNTSGPRTTSTCLVGEAAAD